MTTQERERPRSPYSPPNPHSSPPRQRHKQKQDDPFLNLDNASRKSQSPHASSRKSDDSTEQRDSLLTKILISPLLMTSFLLSLFFVNHADRRRRINSRKSSSSSLSGWLNPEPYQDSQSSAPDRRDSASDSSSSEAEPSDAQNGGNGNRKKQESWHLKKKIRQIVRLEVSDAFEMSGTVLIGLVLGLFVGVVGLFYVGIWVARKIW